MPIGDYVEPGPGAAGKQHAPICPSIQDALTAEYPVRKITERHDVIILPLLAYSEIIVSVLVVPSRHWPTITITIPRLCRGQNILESPDYSPSTPCTGFMLCQLLQPGHCQCNERPLNPQRTQLYIGLSCRILRVNSLSIIRFSLAFSSQCAR